MKHLAVAKFIAVALITWLLVACGGGEESALSPASPHKNATATLVEPQSGWWWNPAESGSGYSIERQGNQIFMAAYLYETSGLATWYVSGLTRQSSGAYSGAMQRYSGGQTLLGSYKAPAATTSVVANALLSFNTVSTGTLTISFADGSPSRTVALQRLAISSPTAFAPSNGSFDNGWWWSEAESGRGYYIEVQGSQAFIGSYMFDSSGQPTWYVSYVSNLQGSQTMSGALDQYASGQALGSSYKAPTKAAASAGTMAFNFTGRTTANMVLPNGRTVALQRFIFSALPTTNLAPSANAGFAQSVGVGSVATLDGSASTDLNADPLTYQWTLTSKPAGSAASLSSSTAVKPTLTPDVAGDYQVSLVVNDGKLNSSTTAVAIRAGSFTMKQDVTAILDNIVGMVGGDAASGITQQLTLILQQVMSAGSGSTCPAASVTPALTNLDQLPPNLQIAINYATGCTAQDGKVMSGSAAISFTNLQLTSNDVAKTTSLSASNFSMVFNSIKVNVATFASGSASGDLNLLLGQDAAGAMTINSGHATLLLTDFLVPNGTIINGTTRLTVTSLNNMSIAINMTAPNGTIALNLSVSQRSDGSTVINTTAPGQGRGYAIEIKDLKLNSTTCPANYPIGGSIVFTKAGQTATATFDATCSGKYAYSDSSGASS